MSDTYEKVKEIIKDLLGVDDAKITPEARFREDLEADSLDLVELIMKFEDDFGAEIKDEDAQKITTVGEAVSYINDNMPGGKKEEKVGEESVPTESVADEGKSEEEVTPDVVKESEETNEESIGEESVPTESVADERKSEEEVTPDVVKESEETNEESIGEADKN